MKIKIYNPKNDKVEEVEKIVKSDDKWREILTPEQFEVTRKKETEKPFSNVCPLPSKKEGIYECVGCATALFHFGSKFESGTGWPSFYEPISKLNVIEKSDKSFNMDRIEVVCARCNAHLGHVSADGPPPTGQRYCINAVALKLSQ